MSNYIHLIVRADDQFEKDVIIAHLFQSGFEGIEEKEDGLNAFIKEDQFNEEEIQEVLDEYKLPYLVSIVAPQNWNALWESNFEPVTVGDFCNIRAEFHEKNDAVALDILITPKMSFGTGHHATTYMMVNEMKDLDFKQKSVADFGTGTGVLAIIAEKLGAGKVWAIDHDDYSIENAWENFEKNNCLQIDLHKDNTFSAEQKFDIILANINKNVIIDNIEKMSLALNVGGKILLSGLLKQDEHDVLMISQAFCLRRVKTVERDKWIAILLEHNI